MKQRTLWVRTATSLVGQGLNLAFGVAVSVPLGRGLGPAGKGDFALYSWAIGLAVVLLGRGWHNAAATAASGDDARGVEAVWIGRRRLLPILASLLLAATICLLLGRIGWGLAALVASCQIWSHPAGGAMIGSGRLGPYYAGLLVQNAVLLAGTAAMWSWGVLTPERAIAVLAVAAACAGWVHSRLAGAGLGLGGATRRESQLWLIDLSRNAWLADLAAFLNYRLDVGIVRYFTGAQGLGLYSTATSIAELARLAPNAIGQAALRDLGRVEPAQQRGVATRTAATAVAASLAIGGALAAVAPWVIPKMYGAAFAPAAPLVMWLAPGIAALAVASASASWLAISGRSRATARLAWRGCALSTAASLVLVAAYGITGAAVASSIGYSILAAMAWRAARRGSPTC